MGTLQLYHWSTSAQLVSVLMIATFFAVLSRAVRRYEVAAWAVSWWCNAVALIVTVDFWLFGVTGFWKPFTRALFVGSKTASAVLLVSGALAMNNAARRRLSVRDVLIATAIGALLGAFVLITIDRIGVVVQGGLALLFISTGIMLVGVRRETNWLGTGLILRGGVALVEAVAYYFNSLPPNSLSAPASSALSLFIGSHSSADLALDWLLALGGVLAITRRNQSELEQTNTVLLGAQEELRRVADRDVLTSLANRRVLPQAFRAVYHTGAAIVFFDIDDFKKVNDTLGHAAGDTQLVQFAHALRGAFRPSDVIVRYAGDEFVVVAETMSREMAEERLRQLRDSVDISFSAGIEIVKPDGDAEAALKTADESMYAQKSSSRRRISYG